MINTISFPGLGIGPFRISETIDFLNISIHLYGLIIGVGIILAYSFCLKICNKHGLTKDNITDILLYGLPSSIICARVYYVIFEWQNYKDNIIDIFKIWEGGIAIYGAIIGGAVSTYFYCRAKKIDPLKAFDVGAYGLLIGQICGRWGNFVNAEAFGAPTTLPWRMQIAEISTQISFHPTFLYESLWNLLIFIILVSWRYKRSFDGEIFFRYIALYGLGRFFIEGIRLDSLYLGPFRISQIVAFLCVIAGIVGIVARRKKTKRQ